MTEDWKKMMSSHIEKMGDAHIMEALHIWKGLDAERLRQDPKVCYAWDKAIAEAKKRNLINDKPER